MKVFINRWEIESWKSDSKILECYTEDNGRGFLDVVVYYENELFPGDLEMAHEVIIPHCMLSDFLQTEGRSEGNEAIQNDAYSNQSEIREFLTIERMVMFCEVVPDVSEIFNQIFEPVAL